MNLEEKDLEKKVFSFIYYQLSLLKLTNLFLMFYKPLLHNTWTNPR